MQLIVQQYLNARIGNPSTDAPIPFYQVPGFVLNIDDIAIGQELDGNSIWYHNADDGCYYWSGAVSEPEQPLSDKTFTPAEELSIYESAVKELTGKYRFIPGYKGLGAGFKEIEGELQSFIALVFYVIEKTPAEGKIPPVINYRGIPLITDVREIGRLSLLAPNEADNASPYLMGGSISEDLTGNDTSFGTRTLIVTKDQQDYLLTCFHVACNTLFKQKKYSLGTSEIHTLLPSTLVTPVPKPLRLQVAQGNFDTLYDYALINLENAPLSNTMPDVQFNGFYTRAELRSGFLTGITMSKYGAATQRGNTAKLIAYRSDSVEVSENPKLFMSGLVEAGCMASEGDSGAPVINVSNNKLVGFVVAGNSSVTYILPFAQLASQLSIIPKL
jgi:Trypsin